MAITSSGDPIVIQIVETHTSTIPGEEELTAELKNQTARMLETCFDHRREDVLQTAARTFAETAVHLHTLLCLQEGVHHSQWSDESDPFTGEKIAEKREEINDTVRDYIERQVRRFITITG